MTAKGRDFEGLGPELHVRQAKPPADNPAVPEQLLDLMRMGRRADVEVFRPAPEQEIPHAAADQVRDVVVLVEPVQHFQRVRVDVSAGNRVSGPGNDGRLHHGAEL